MTLKNSRTNGREVNLKKKRLEGDLQDGLERQIQVVKWTPKENRRPGAEMNFKAKRRWEILRRTEIYHRDWDAAFAQMVETLKLGVSVRPDDLGGEKDRGKRKKLKGKKDLQTWEALREKQFQQKWPPDKLKGEFLYSTYTPQGRELADKYRLFTPFHYDDPLWEPYKDHMPFIFTDMMPVRVIAQNPTTHKIGPDRKVIFDYTPHLRDGRFLTMEIDLYEKQGPIRGLINYHLDFYQDKLNLPKVKKRGRALDFYIYYKDKDNIERKISIYELWDMNKRYGKSPWKITKELYPSETDGKHYQVNNDNYDSDVRAIWMQINTTIKTAEKEINPPL